MHDNLVSLSPSIAQENVFSSSKSRLHFQINDPNSLTSFEVERIASTTPIQTQCSETQGEYTLP